MPKFTGECRIAGVNGQPNRVSVTDGDMVWAMSMKHTIAWRATSPISMICLGVLVTHHLSRRPLHNNQENHQAFAPRIDR